MSRAVEVLRVSSCAIKPHYDTEESQQTYSLTPWDLAMLSVHYIQKGLLFTKPPHLTMEAILEQLKDSLSLTLAHFFPLAGRLVTKKGADPPSYSVFLNCTNAPGAEFIYATAQVTMADFNSPDVPPFVASLFAFHEIINHDGHVMPLLAVQVTELIDGIFVGCSFNHSVADGTSFWHFFNAWSEISPPLRERIFRFSAQSIARLKAKANSECNTTKISSFQALSALVWRSITRTRHLPYC